MHVDSTQTISCRQCTMLVILPHISEATFVVAKVAGACAKRCQAAMSGVLIPCSITASSAEYQVQGARTTYSAYATMCLCSYQALNFAMQAAHSTWRRNFAHSSTRTSNGRNWIASEVAVYLLIFVMSTCRVHQGQWDEAHDPYALSLQNLRHLSAVHKHQDMVDASCDQLQRMAAQEVLVPGAVRLVCVRLVGSLHVT